MEQTKPTRNYGVDLLKTASMFMVVVLHVLGKGGILNALPTGTLRYEVAWLLECAAYCAVDCFALTTGYLMVGRGFKYRKISYLWAIVFFYTVALMPLHTLVFGQDISQTRMTYFLPATSGQFWYFSAYFCLFFFIPFLNRLIDSLSKREYCRLLLTGFVLFCALRVLTPFDHSAFGMASGYNVWWLIYLYLFGAGLKKHRLFSSLSCGKAGIGYLCAVLFTWGSKFVISLAQNSDITFLSKLAELYGAKRFVSYLSPSVLLSALFLMLFCIKLPIPRFFHRPLRFLAPLIFQVYIIHVHYAVGSNIMNKGFVPLASLPAYLLPFAVLGCAAAVFFACIFVDWLRSLLFRLLHINEGIDLLSDKLVSAYHHSKFKARIDRFTEQEEEQP